MTIHAALAGAAERETAPRRTSATTSTPLVTTIAMASGSIDHIPVADA